MLKNNPTTTRLSDTLIIKRVAMHKVSQSDSSKISFLTLKKRRRLQYSIVQTLHHQSFFTMCLPTLILCMFRMSYCVHSNDGIDFVDTCSFFIASNEYVQHLRTHTPSDNAMLLKFSQVVPLLLVLYSLKRFYKRTLYDAVAANSV
jgi:hypothetical protein